MKERFNLRDDKADDAEIESRIRESIELRGATPWILVFAIFVASVGLNVNSAAVIIGAMLISPLMGPIMGAGLGAAVFDFDLVKRSLINLGIATGMLPVTGLPLPLVSYGGSSILATLLALGCVLAVARRRVDVLFEE